MDQKHVDLLELLVEIFFRTFPLVLQLRQFTYYHAWFFLLWTLNQKGDAVFDGFVERSVYLGVVVSIQPDMGESVAPPGMPVTLHQKALLCVAYSAFWKSLQS